ncbi:hypothetical protein [Leifsonia aquatica]|uniref:hypothetical protein n=1 Tax=Leifsonia aquatica TaxID=144185 RepID=UPI003805FDDC
MANPLVATAVDTATPFSGAYLIEDGRALVDAVNSGSWVEGGVAAFSAALDTAAMIVDPIGTLIANGLGWVLDHVEPLKGWMNDFTGDAGQVSAFAQTWRNVAGQMHDGADAFARRTHDLDGMSGATVDAYLAFAGDTIAHLHATGDWANAIAQGMEVASQLVQVVHDLVRDAISQVVGTAISVAAEMALTVGLATPVAIGQITTKVASLATKVGRSVTRLLTSFKELGRLLDSLKALFTKGSALVTKMLRDGGGTVRNLLGGGKKVTIPSLEEFEAYKNALPTRGANYGKSGARDFQRTHAGGTEYKIGEGDESLWADGLTYDPSSGGVAVEAKFVENPNGSSLYEGTSPPFLAFKLNDVDEEIRRYASAISDPKTPLTRLDVVVSTEKARDFLSDRIAGVLRQLENGGATKIDWTITVGGTK